MSKLNQKIKELPLINSIVYDHRMYNKKNEKFHYNNQPKYIAKHFLRTRLLSNKKGKSEQFRQLINTIEICPVENNEFFYSIDYFKMPKLKYHILDNYSIDYKLIIESSFKEIISYLNDDEFSNTEKKIIQGLHDYLGRCYEEERIRTQYGRQLDSIQSLFERPAKTFFEGLQRALFYNQFLWQSGHKHNGFPHLDRLLISLYRNDIKNGRLTEEEAERLISSFFNVLHENYWYKSVGPVGDTGQILVIGGIDINGQYQSNELTHLFIRVSKKLHFPDPKVLLRCSPNMPTELLCEALDCIATGIGAPFLSNDIAVIPALMSFGYSKKDAYNYATAACWEPLVIGNSCDQNNIKSLNFATPLIELMNSEKFDRIEDMNELKDQYLLFLSRYLQRELTILSNLRFEKSPLFSLVSESCLISHKDIVRGGAQYCNLGVTTVGMGTVINSLLNINRLVFEDKKYTLKELNGFRANDFKNNEGIIKELKNLDYGYGSDDAKTIDFTQEILDFTSKEFSKYKTYLGGKFKFGLSSPDYVNDATNTEATLDGRKRGEPFSVHISSNSSIPITELFSFAAKLDYNGNRLNGNVVDFLAAPSTLRDNLKKYVLAIKQSFSLGVYQMQINVVDSETLVDAKKHPEKYPQLIVRVWGFSAYFNDLPEEYQNVLIQRALVAEGKVA